MTHGGLDLNPGFWWSHTLRQKGGPSTNLEKDDFLESTEKRAEEYTDHPGFKAHIVMKCSFSVRFDMY